MFRIVQLRKLENNINLRNEFLPFFNFSVSVKHETCKGEKNNSPNSCRPYVNDCLGVTVNLCDYLKEKRKTIKLFDCKG